MLGHKTPNEQPQRPGAAGPSIHRRRKVSDIKSLFELMSLNEMALIKWPAVGEMPRAYTGLPRRDAFLFFQNYM